MHSMSIHLIRSTKTGLVSTQFTVERERIMVTSSIPEDRDIHGGRFYVPIKPLSDQTKKSF